MLAAVSRDCFRRFETGTAGNDSPLIWPMLLFAAFLFFVFFGPRGSDLSPGLSGLSNDCDGSFQRSAGMPVAQHEALMHLRPLPPRLKASLSST